MAYRDFMYKNKEVFKGKVVLDIGCGTGILSMFAARAGAKQVIGIDAADIIDKARIIVKANGLDDVITLVKSKVEAATIPVDKVKLLSPLSPSFVPLSPFICFSFALFLPLFFCLFRPLTAPSPPPSPSPPPHHHHHPPRAPN